MVENRIGLCTFPDDDKDYCKYFEVDKDWLIDILEKQATAIPLALDNGQFTDQMFKMREKEWIQKISQTIIVGMRHGLYMNQQKKKGKYSMKKHVGSKNAEQLTKNRKVLE